MKLSTLQLTEQLIARASVTPQDAGCLDLITSQLEGLGFEFHRLNFGPTDASVSNLIAWRKGADPAGPVLAFAGHTDVVPTGPTTQWTSAPFTPSHREGKLYGRGAADMKASLAAMTVAIRDFVTQHPAHRGAIALLLTSDEEGPSVDGTIRLCEWLQARGQTIDHCIVGEPTSVKSLGDMVKNGRRGSLSGKLTVRGVQGHIAYPHLADNPIHKAAPALAALSAEVWDTGNDYFPPTSWQMSNIHAGTGAGNVIPGELTVDFNFRFCTVSTPEGLKARVHAILDQHDLNYSVAWTLGGEPFLTPRGTLVDALCEAISSTTGIEAELSTTGGTSDGRFIAKICPQVVEFGPVNASIHKIDEHVEVASLVPLTNIYRRTLEALILT